MNITERKLNALVNLVSKAKGHEEFLIEFNNIATSFNELFRGLSRNNLDHYSFTTSLAVASEFSTLNDGVIKLDNAVGISVPLAYSIVEQMIIASAYNGSIEYCEVDRMLNELNEIRPIVDAESEVIVSLNESKNFKYIVEPSVQP